MRYICVDPGSAVSAFVVWDGERVLWKGKRNNSELLIVSENGKDSIIVIEMIASYGMPVGKEVFETCLWIGRFIQVGVMSGSQVYLVYRRDIKMHHCNSVKAKDSNIRQSIIDKYGKPGTKKSPNVVYNDSVEKMSGDLWAAFAIATAVTENPNLKMFQI